MQNNLSSEQLLRFIRAGMNILLVILVSGFLATIVQICWNAFFPAVFHLSRITMEQAAAFVVICLVVSNPFNITYNIHRHESLEELEEDDE